MIVDMKFSSQMSFQYLKGAIGRAEVAYLGSDLASFQYLKGAIGRLPDGPVRIGFWRLSIPQRCDWKN